MKISSGIRLSLASIIAGKKLAAAVPEVQISAVGTPDFLAIPNAKKLADRSSSMGIVSI